MSSHKIFKSKLHDSSPPSICCKYSVSGFVVAAYIISYCRFLSQVDAQLLVVQKLEEKEGVLQSTLAALEKELGVRTQALELNKRKVS